MFISCSFHVINENDFQMYLYSYPKSQIKKSFHKKKSCAVKWGIHFMQISAFPSTHRPLAVVATNTARRRKAEAHSPRKPMMSTAGISTAPNGATSGSERSRGTVADAVGGRGGVGLWAQNGIGANMAFVCVHESASVCALWGEGLYHTPWYQRCQGPKMAIFKWKLALLAGTGLGSPPPPGMCLLDTP